MSVCIISSFITGFGKTGGFGNMTRQHAIALQQHGCEVTVVVPRKGNQPRLAYDNDLRIIGLDPSQFFSFSTFRTIDADIYHSQNPNFITFIAMLAQPKKKHVVTYRDPRDFADLITELRFGTWKSRLMAPFIFEFENGPFVTYTVKNADLVGCPANYLVEKTKRKYKRSDIILLPNIERFPKRRFQRNTKPTVCFVGRLDGIKRPEIVFELAESFRDVDFIIAGEAQAARRHRALAAKAAELPNVTMLGAIDKFKSDELSRLYAQSWVLINTSAREGLPLTFIEAAGRGCAILSSVNPDNFASGFGYWVQDGDFAKGLAALLANNLWKTKGKLGQRYVKQIYDERQATEVHLQAYRNLLANQEGIRR